MKYAWVLALVATAVMVPAQAATPPAPPASQSAMAQVTRSVLADVSANAKGAVVFVGPLKSDEPAPRGTELTSKLAALVASGLGPGASARSEPVPLSTAQALARKATVLVFLQIEIATGQLRLTADAFRTTRNVWERARQPIPLPIAHAFASARIDGEVRTYLAPVPLLLNHIDKIPIEDHDIVALACGDVDGDGGIEVVTLSRRRATVGRLRGGRFVTARTASLRDLSGIAPAPLREPIGGVAIVSGKSTQPPHIDLGITDRQRGSRLDGDLRSLGTISGVPFSTPSGDACVRFQGSALTASIGKCAEADVAVDAAEVETPLDAAAVGSFVRANGKVSFIVATRDPRNAELRLRADGQTASLPHAGAQIAIADLDQDGSPEIISTLDVLGKAGGDDALVVTTWQPGAPPRERARTAVSAGVRAVAACPPEGVGAAPIVLATSGELWVVR
ncbi:MAG TPA: hypothetical protein VF881_07430 [Polyangiaceae bacterium]